eukprot:366359-Chlamydomonas_euryale.AAC.4
MPGAGSVMVLPTSLSAMPSPSSASNRYDSFNPGVRPDMITCTHQSACTDDSRLPLASGLLGSPPSDSQTDHFTNVLPASPACCTYRVHRITDSCVGSKLATPC